MPSSPVVGSSSVSSEIRTRISFVNASRFGTFTRNVIRPLASLETTTSVMSGPAGSSSTSSWNVMLFALPVEVEGCECAVPAPATRIATPAQASSTRDIVNKDSRGGR
jgi:hypothetical protein